MKWIWLDNADGSVADESGGLRLVVKAVGGMTRFLVTRTDESSSNGDTFLVGSGTSLDTSSAMRAAESFAARLRETRPKQGVDILF